MNTQPKSSSKTKTRRSRRDRIWLIFFAVATLWRATPAQTADSVHWQIQDNKVDAEIRSWDLQQLLENISTATGWQVFVEPETQRTVSAKFKGLTSGEALERLLGNLNFALLPQSNAPSKLFVFRTTAQEATQLVKVTEKQKKSAKAVPNELVVTLKPGSKESIDDIAKKLGAKVTGRLDDLRAYRLKFDDDEAVKAAREFLSDNSDVGSVDSNYYVARPPAIEPLAASSALPFSLKPTVSTDASKLIIGLIDTPIQKTGAAYDAFMLPSVSVTDESGGSSSGPTHATSMSETILQGLAIGANNSSAGSVRILPVDVYGNNGDTTTFAVAQGISAAINAGATIINLSLGSDGNSGFLKTLIQNSHQQGVVFFAAAGNEPTTAPTYPAAYPEVVAVTAGDRRGNVSSYANYGSFVDVIAPGTSIVYYNGRSYMVSGTSSATAFMSGIAASLSTATGKLPAQVESQVRRTFTFKSANGSP